MNSRLKSKGLPYDSHDELEGSNVLIIGGTGGIGRACVNSFAEHGSNIGFTFHHARNIADALVQRWRSRGRAISARQVNLESDGSLEKLAPWVSAEYRHLDALVMCQGVIEGKSLRDYSVQAIRRVFDINTISVIKLSKSLSPFLAKNSAMVIIASISAHAGSYDPVYASSKGALVSFTKAIAREFAPTVRVNTIAPALTRGTGMFSNMSEKTRARHLKSTPLRRLATPEDVAAAVLFLSGPASRHITGACIDVNGGEYLR